jgi:GDP-L-fucose synthase
MATAALPVVNLEKHSKIFVAGHRGMVGSAMVRRLQTEGCRHLVLRSRAELDLTRQADVERFFQTERPEFVFLAAARVGGIFANNTYRAEFSYTNLAIETNVIHSAWQAGVQGLLFFSSSCVYPRACPQPMKEEHLFSGAPEPTNEPYAVAKLAGMSLCRAYRDQYGANFTAVIPTNLYGPNDNYDPQQSHLLAALIRKFHEAKVAGQRQVTLWGSGTPRRELMFVDDAVDAALFVLRNYTGKDPVNVGVGSDLTIREIAAVVMRVVGFAGEIVCDRTKPDGAPQKLLDVAKLKSLGWTAETSLEDGVARAYADFLAQQQP